MSEMRALPLLPTSSCQDRKSTRLNSSHQKISYAVFCLKKKTQLLFDIANTIDSIAGTQREWYRHGDGVCNRPRRKLWVGRKADIVCFFLRIRGPRRFTPFPYTTLFR